MKPKNLTNHLFYSASVLAAITATASAAEVVAAGESAGPPLYRKFTLGVEGGTTGIGGSFSWRFADHFGVRAGGDYLSLSDTGVKIDHIHYNATVRLLSEPLTLDYYPWQKSSFHISAGMQFNQNRLTGSADTVGTIIIGGEPFPEESVGTLKLKVEQQPVNPYLSIGGNFFYFDRAHHWAFGGELGLTYTGDPDTSLTRSGPPSTVVDAAVRRAESGSRITPKSSNGGPWRRSR